MPHSNQTSLTRPIFAASFIFSWIFWGALLLLTRLDVFQPGTPVFMILFILGGLGPTIMPLVLIRRLLPKQDAKQVVRKQMFGFKVPVKYYAAAVILTTLFFAVHYLASFLLAGGYTRYGDLTPWYQVLILFPAMIIGGGLEEIGWRGIGVPELFRRWSPIQGTLAIGVIWMIWHVPLFLIPGTSQYGTDFLSFTAMGFAFSLILSPLMYFSGSAVPCIIAHALFNAFYGLQWVYPINDALNTRILDLILLLFGVLVWSLWFYIEKDR
jgi:membrane protease YdiL (CAAX protease family)